MIAYPCLLIYDNRKRLPGDVKFQLEFLIFEDFA